MTGILVRLGVSIGIPFATLALFGFWAGVAASLLVLTLWAYGLVTWWEETN